MKLRIGVPLLLLALLIAGATALSLSRPARSLAGGGAVPLHAGMSDAAMADMAKRYWSTHTPTGPTSATPRTTTAFVDTVTVSSFIFNADNDPGTPVDTVRLRAGDQVFFQWLGGVHTATSGVDASDPNVGVIFDQPVDNVHTSYLFTSTVAETIPFFCRYHVTFGMKGVLEFVDPPPAGVGASAVRIGFAGRPWPNPSRSTVSFRYALARAGHVHAEVLDVRGRRVAVALDAERAAGTYEAAWDGRLAAGRLAPAGRYFVRLAVPGAVQSRAVTLLR